MNDQLTKQLTAVIMAHGLALAANAQTPNANEASGGTNVTQKLPDVVVKGQQEQSEPYKPDAVQSPRFTEPLRDTPQTITVVPRAVIEQQNATTLRDVLRNVPGISFQAGEGGVPAGDNLTIRGFGARTDLFVDGVRDFGGYTRDPFSVEQVEVVKGPASAYAGRGSTGGSINLVSKRPGLDPFYAGSFGMGSEDYKRLTLDVNQPLTKVPIDGTALRLNGMWTDAGVPGRDAVENERWGFAPAVTFGLDTPTRVTLSYYHLEHDNLPDYGIPWVPVNTGPLAAYSNEAPPVDFNNFYGLKDKDFETTRTYLPTALIEHDFNESFSLRNVTRFGRTDRDSVITAPRFANANASVVINRQNQSRDQADSIWANQTDFTSRFPTWKLDHTLVTSLEYAHETSLNYLRSGPVSQTTLFNPNPSDPYPAEVSRFGVRNEAEADTLAVSLFDTIKINEQWQLVGGVRFDHFAIDYQPITNSAPRDTLERTDNEVTWRSGVVYKPQKNGSIYAAYGTSFNPAAEGLTISSTPTAANNLSTDPEKSQTVEVGTKWDLFENRLSLSLAVFRTEKTDARTTDPVTGEIVLGGEQRVDGVELGAAGRITKDWQVFAGYAHMISEVTDSGIPAEEGAEINNTPENTFNLWTTYQLPWHLEIGAGMQYVDSRFSNNNRDTRREAPSYMTFDAMAGWSPHQRFSLRLNVYNLADEEYIDRVGGGHFVPGAGTSATLTANFRF